MNDSMQQKLKRIIVVEDDPIVQKAVIIALGTIGDFEVDGCDTGREAFELLRQSAPDLLLLDYRLPDIDGLELFETMKNDETLRDIPVIFITGSVMPDHVKAYEEAGAIGVIPKPFDARTLAGVVENMWARRAL